jgi:Dolichyl-phosphate-mannose-protein mannosyltransferase
MRKSLLILSGFIAVKFILQFTLIDAGYDLQRDEFLHLDQAKHLAWGYMSVPPFTSWNSYLIHLFGGSVFWVKFFPALYGALTIFFVWKTIEALNGNLFACISGAACVLFSALLRINILYQPNSFDILSWTMVYFIIIKYINTSNSKWLFAGAVFFALGFLNKYNIAFLLIGLLPALLLSDQRKIFTNQKLYIAVLLGLLIILPNLIWQYRNNFPVIHHLKELADTQLVNIDRADFLKSQLLFFMGGLVAILCGLYALWAYKPFWKFRFFFWTMIFTLAAFVYFKAKPYYATGIYPVYIAFGSVYLGEILKNGWKRYLQPAVALLPVVLFIPFYNIGFPNKSPEYIIQHQEQYRKFGLLHWEDGKDHQLPQDFADMLGWKDLAAKVDSIYATLPDTANLLILCDNYGQAGAINYYTRHPALRASSFNADYLNWLPLDKKITNAILVKEADDEDKERKVEIPLFDTVYLAGKRINPYAREDTISIYVLLGAKVDINQRIKSEAAEEKMSH